MNFQEIIERAIREDPANINLTENEILTKIENEVNPEPEEMDDEITESVSDLPRLDFSLNKVFEPLETFVPRTAAKMKWDDLFLEVYVSLLGTATNSGIHRPVDIELDSLTRMLETRFGPSTKPDLYTNEDLLLHFARHCLFVHGIERTFFPPAGQTSFLESINSDPDRQISAFQEFNLRIKRILKRQKIAESRKKNEQKRIAKEEEEENKRRIREEIDDDDEEEEDDIDENTDIESDIDDAESVDSDELEEAIESGGVFSLTDSGLPKNKTKDGTRTRITPTNAAMKAMVSDEAKSFLTLSEFSALLDGLGFQTDAFRLFAILDHIEHFREVPTASQLLLELDIRSSLGMTTEPVFVRRERKVDLNFIEYFLVQKEIDPDTFQISRTSLDWVIRRYRRVDPMILEMEKMDKKLLKEKLSRERKFLGMNITMEGARGPKKKKNLLGSDSDDDDDENNEEEMEDDVSIEEEESDGGGGIKNPISESGSNKTGGQKSSANLSNAGGGENVSKTTDNTKNENDDDDDDIKIRQLPDPDTGIYFQEAEMQLNVPPPILTTSLFELEELKRQFASWCNDSDPPEWGFLLNAFKEEGDHPWNHSRFKALLLRRGFKGPINKTINMIVTLANQPWTSEIGPEDIRRAQRLLEPDRSLKLQDRYPMYGTGIKLAN